MDEGNGKDAEHDLLRPGEFENAGEAEDEGPTGEDEEPKNFEEECVT